MRAMILVLCCFAAFSGIAFASDMYECTGADGVTIVTNVPKEGMICDLQKNLSDSSQNVKSSMSDSDCRHLYEDNENKECQKNVFRKMRKKLSSYCSFFVEAVTKESRDARMNYEGRKEVCKSEMLTITSQMLPELLKCNKLPDDSECRKKTEQEWTRNFNKVRWSSEDDRDANSFIEYLLAVEFLVPLDH
jgi:hypothetical protein